LSFQDRTLACVDCKADFTFTGAEQEFYAKKGFTNDPKRCTTCRSAKKQRLGVQETVGQRQMFQAVCATCGKDTTLPFEPRNGRPVYCSDCFTKSKS
jgi:CxxC-x17-CxxC domain-containing protein